MEQEHGSLKDVRTLFKNLPDTDLKIEYQRQRKIGTKRGKTLAMIARSIIRSREQEKLIVEATTAEAQYLLGKEIKETDTAQP